MKKYPILYTAYCFFMLLFFPLLYAENFIVTSTDEIENVMQNALPGDTLFMANGVWENAQIKFIGNGNETNPIVLHAQSNGGVILIGNSNLRISGSYLEVNGLRFVGGQSPSGAVIEFRNSNNPATNSRITNCGIYYHNRYNLSINDKWLSIYGVNNRVDHCYFEGKMNPGATFVVWFSNASTPHNHLIENNYFGYRPELGINGGETIRIGTSTYSMNISATTVQRNYFERCNGEIEIISNKSCENIFKQNTFFECEGTLTLRHGNRAIVESNYFIGNQKQRTGGIRVIGEDHHVINNYLIGLTGSGFRSALTLVNGVENSPLNRYFQVKNATIGFNTIIDCSNPITIGAGANSELSLPPDSVFIYNNIINDGNQVLLYEDIPTNISYAGNMYFDTDLGIDSLTGFTGIDPGLDLDTNNIWRLSEYSNAVNAAAGNYPEILFDFDGQPRDDNLDDVGCDEYSDSDIQTGPVFSTDIGPTWKGSSDIPLVLVTRVKGAGTVLKIPDQQYYNSGTEITLIAVPVNGATFQNWNGDPTLFNDTLVYTINEDKYFQANFNEIPNYSISSWINGNGTVSYWPDNNSYTVGTEVSITANPDSNWVFTHWSGDISGTQNPINVTMNSSLSITVNFSNVLGITDNENNNNNISYSLKQNYPNPFNAFTVIPYSIEKPSNVVINIYDITGILIYNSYFKMAKGNHSYRWNGQDQYGNFAPSGIYFIQLHAEKYEKVIKANFLR